MNERRLSCRCGKVVLGLSGPPILAVNCACSSCRSAAIRLEARYHIPLREAEDSVGYVMQRRDRLAVLQGEAELRESTLTPKASTRRVVASCCGTALFTDFRQGHWLSVFATLWPADERPAPELRSMVMDHPNPEALDPAIPNAKRQTAGFMWKLLKAWAAMGFRTGPRRDLPVLDLPPEAR